MIMIITILMMMMMMTLMIEDDNDNNNNDDEDDDDDDDDEDCNNNNWMFQVNAQFYQIQSTEIKTSNLSPIGIISCDLFYQEVNPILAKPPLNFNGGLAKCELTSWVNSPLVAYPHPLRARPLPDRLLAWSGLLIFRLPINTELEATSDVIRHMGTQTYQLIWPHFLLTQTYISMNINLK